MLLSLRHAAERLDIHPDTLRREFFAHEKFVGTLYRAVKPDVAAISNSLSPA